MTIASLPDTEVESSPDPQEPGALTDGIHLVVDALKLNDVQPIYGVVGIPITDLARLAQASGIRYIGFRHESDAGQARCQFEQALVHPPPSVTARHAHLLSLRYGAAAVPAGILYTKCMRIQAFCHGELLVFCDEERRT